MLLLVAAFLPTVADRAAAFFGAAFGWRGASAAWAAAAGGGPMRAPRRVSVFGLLRRGFRLARRFRCLGGSGVRALDESYRQLEFLAHRRLARQHFAAVGFVIMARQM